MLPGYGGHLPPSAHRHQDVTGERVRPPAVPLRSPKDPGCRHGVGAGRAMTGPAACRLAVGGGGLAGITTALRCAEAGAAVALYESRPRLGGLTSSFRRGELWVDNGQHVFLRCCTSYRSLLHRLGVEGLSTLQPRLD